MESIFYWNPMNSTSVCITGNIPIFQVLQEQLIKLWVQFSILFAISSPDSFYIPPKENIPRFYPEAKSLFAYHFLNSNLLLCCCDWILSKIISGNKWLLYMVLSDHSPSFWKVKIETKGREWRGKKRKTKDKHCFLACFLAWSLSHSHLASSSPDPLA